MTVRRAGVIAWTFVSLLACALITFDLFMFFFLGRTINVQNQTGSAITILALGTRGDEVGPLSFSSSQHPRVLTSPLTPVALTENGAATLVIYHYMHYRHHSVVIMSQDADIYEMPIDIVKTNELKVTKRTPLPAGERRDAIERVMNNTESGIGVLLTYSLAIVFVFFLMARIVCRRIGRLR